MATKKVLIGLQFDYDYSLADSIVQDKPTAKDKSNISADYSHVFEVQIEIPDKVKTIQQFKLVKI